MGLPWQWSRSLLSGTMSGLDDGCTRVVHEITEWCPRLRSGARVVHGSTEWCTSGARDEYTRVRSSARVVHEITEWCTSTSGA